MTIDYNSLDRVLATCMVDGRDIIAAGPITKQPYTRPYRIIIRLNSNGELVVCNQYFDINKDYDDLYLACLKANSDYGNGVYTTHLSDAISVWAKRLSNDTTYTESIYREMNKQNEVQ